MFTIGAFSKLSHVSARMLRHYDAIGLLRPALVGGENGYRYYDAAQLSVLLQIEGLKGYGFTLAEIAALLPLPSEELARQMHIRRLSAYRELNEMRGRIRRMEDEIIQMEGIGMANDKYHVVVMDCPEQKVFGLRRTINIAQIHELFTDLAAEMARRGLRRTGATQLLYHGEEFSYDNAEVEAQAVVDADGPEIGTVPGGSYAAVTHTGPYETIRYAYEAVCAWLAAHPEYRICGPAIERYLKDEGMVSSPEELETGVLFPVERTGVSA